MKKHLIIPILAATSLCMGHDEVAQQGVSNLPDYAERVARTKALEPEKMDPALQNDSLYRLRKQDLAAQGLTPSQIAEALYGGQFFAYPYSSRPELKSQGNVKTLTLLIDFKDERASDNLPKLTTDALHENIYGQGTAYALTQTPYDSVSAYYKRASQGKVNVQGNVLGWYHFPNDRKTYQPNVAGLTLQQKMLKENAAIFSMLKEALQSYDNGHDFSQYDNDDDGDIDLITILYSGPATGWGSFWWAYRWNFFIQEAASLKFDGKRAKQFVFQFVSERNGGKDFDPETLLHEVGHAFGLPDYYDYDKDLGPPGGVGKLDMMDANWANHNAFSRWLLDWIKPEIISSGSPVEKTLVASGSATNTNKAIAIFPNLPNGNAPGQELFIIENRFPVGNDGGIASLPGKGLLIWHVVATPNDSDNGFSLDNSYTSTKLIKLLRADSANDFDSNDRAGSKTFFVSGKEFTPTSSPDSRSYAGKHTGVSITDISAPGEVMKIKVGFVPILAGPDNNASGMTAIQPDPPAASDGASGSEKPLDLEALESAAAKAASATPDELRKAWEQFNANADKEKLGKQERIVLEMQLRQWASKEGATAIASVAGSKAREFAAKVLPALLSAWSSSDPQAVSAWYASDAGKALFAQHSIEPDSKFMRNIFGWRAKTNFQKALDDAVKLADPKELVWAIQGVEPVASTFGIPSEVIFEASADSALSTESRDALKVMLLDRAARSVQSDVSTARDAIKNYDILNEKMAFK